MDPVAEMAKPPHLTREMQVRILLGLHIFSCTLSWSGELSARLLSESCRVRFPEGTHAVSSIFRETLEVIMCEHDFDSTGKCKKCGGHRDPVYR